MLYRVAALCFTREHSPFFELARVLVRCNHVASGVINPDHAIM
jgi:hypothetical protein